MRRGWKWVILVIALLLFAACRPAAEDLDSDASGETVDEVLGACQPEEEDCDDEPVAETTVPAATSAPEEAESEPEETESEPDESEAAPAEDATVLEENPLAVTDADWVKGPDDALFTIIEYGDFQ